MQKMQTVTIPQALEIGLQHHQAKRLPEAEAVYRQILTVQPNQADALHLLGLIAQQVGQRQVAVDLIRQAIAANPMAPDYHNNLGIALYELGQLDQAIVS